MSYTIEHLENEGIFLITNIGKFTHKDFMKQAIEAIKIAETQNCHKFLSDCTSMYLETNTMNIYDTSGYYNEINVSRESKIALLVPPGHKSEKDLKFFETVNVNKGWQIKLFGDKESAVKWLQE